MNKYKKKTINKTFKKNKTKKKSLPKLKRKYSFFLVLVLIPTQRIRHSIGIKIDQV